MILIMGQCPVAIRIRSIKSLPIVFVIRVVLHFVQNHRTFQAGVDGNLGAGVPPWRV
jgi:hypothetical protein